MESRPETAPLLDLQHARKVSASMKRDADTRFLVAASSDLADLTTGGKVLDLGCGAVALCRKSARLGSRCRMLLWRSSPRSRSSVVVASKNVVDAASGMPATASSSDVARSVTARRMP